jgi:hypothetical protein
VKSALLACLIGSTAVAADLFPFQLPWDDASPSVTNLSHLNEKPAGRDGFVTVKDGHLFAGENRLRIFGVNVCFGANFPDKEMAPKVAARMAKFGINCVRFHHMDMFSAPAGIFAKDGKTLDPGQLDRLDWFIAKLKEQGIYANLNLHVSRTYPDRPRAEKKGNPDYDKGVDNFCAAMIALQKDYARDLLTHVNPYTGKSYAEEPAVALVEINNENALGFQWWAGQMENLPEPYAGELNERWSKWLVQKYGPKPKAADAAPNPEDWTNKLWEEWKVNKGEMDARISDAWKEGAREEGPELLENGNFTEGMKGWNVEQHGTAEVSSSTEKGLRVEVKKTGQESWHAQFSRGGLKVAGGIGYAVTFRARAPKPMSVSVNLMQAHEPYKVLGSKLVEVGPDWRDVKAVFKTSAADDNARVSMTGLGQTAGVFEFADFSLRTAAIDASVKRDAGKRVHYFTKAALAQRTPAAQRDWQEFIWDTESAYWNGMRDFLKKDLGVKALIVGTQGFWSPGHVQAGMDVIDSHAYWQHPDFLGRGWNQDVWSVKNIPMAGAKDGGTLPGLAAQRVLGKPFICTEYNHAAPNTYSAETFPLLCAFAALQDWDGVFAFSYSHRGAGEWGQEHVNNFFDIDRHPVKMATLPGAVLSFRQPAPKIYSAVWVEPGLKISVREGLAGGPGFARKLLYKDTNPLNSFFTRIALRAFNPLHESAKNSETHMLEGDTGTRGSPDAMPNVIRWNEKGRFAFYVSNRSMVYAGPAAPAERKGLAEMFVQPGASRQDWACYQLTVLDTEEDVDFSTARRMLITASGDVENTGMGWKDNTKSSVGRDWGKSPVLVEGPAAKIVIPGEGKFKAWALDERGQRRGEIAVAGDTLEIGPQHKTLWYEVERQ